ncbi:MAG: C45 family autoproteolytic acyltransferase/hydrolase [Candidatus Pseudomonas phytovorans]|uniref:C45 family autoproteolytic acyltransferase/hydrolase n=1 Tax=Candidatus Pseudomonas phytovorans TaxID=3121377 RepID=A0AAJ5WM56_9PSED|nr:C45 family peptidase [Pseudomonas sp.]WEK33205.1 MAG: C45 family autoproteolytic acyltransferase/hydrolase [Pseudomonas sp.]
MSPVIFRSQVCTPFNRGREFGEVFAGKVRQAVSTYEALFARVAKRPYDLHALGSQALAAIAAFAAPLHEEILGIAAGAGLAPEQVGAINARTEILAYLGVQLRGECSTVVLADPFGAPVTAQTWDWYAEFAGLWLVWEIPHADGRLTTTVTEYGIVGKPGVNDRGLGVHFNILHHQRDGEGIGLPVHVLSRWLLDSCADINHALQLCHAAPVSASSVLTLVAAEQGASAAVSVELHPGGPALVFPDAAGLLIHTNHFLADAVRPYDTEPAAYPDTLVRHDLLRRRLTGRRQLSERDLLGALNSHLGSTGALCCHPDPALPETGQYATLASICLDVPAGTLRALPGGPCRHL